MTNTIKTASLAIISAWSKAWRTARRTYHVAAFASLVIVTYSGWQISHGNIVQFDGVAHAAIPIGNPVPEQMGKLAADLSMPTEVAETGVQQQKTQRHMTYGDLAKDMEKFASPVSQANTAPLPGRKPPVPSKVQQ